MTSQTATSPTATSPAATSPTAGASFDRALAERNKDNVRTFFRLLEEEDIPAFVDLFAENGRQVNPLGGGVFPEEVAGHDALMEFWEPVPERFDGMRFPLDTLLATEDPNVVFANYEGHINLKDGAGTYNNTYFATFRFDDDGKIVHYVEVFDPVVAARAFNLMDQITGADGTGARDFAEDFFSTVDTEPPEALRDYVTDDVRLKMGNDDPIVGVDALVASFESSKERFASSRHDIQGVWSGKWEGGEGDGGEVVSVEAIAIYTFDDGREVRLPVTSTLRLNSERRVTDYRIFMDPGPAFGN